MTCSGNFPVLAVKPYLRENTCMYKKPADFVKRDA